ncbi:unnamed protein product, partial [Rotaria sp. Silwood2]
LSRRIYVDDDENDSTIYVTNSHDSFCALKWVAGASSGIPLGVGLVYCRGISVDKEKNVYLAEMILNTVMKRSPKMNISMVIAGQPGECNSTSKHFCRPEGIFVDQTSGVLYVADSFNNSIQQWSKNAQEGITVAGSSNGIF